MLIATSGPTVEGPQSFRCFQQVTSRDKSLNRNAQNKGLPPVAPDRTLCGQPETFERPFDITWNQSSNYQHTPSVQSQLWHHGQNDAFYSDASCRGYEKRDHTHSLPQMHPYDGHTHHYKNDYPCAIHSYSYQSVNPIKQQQYYYGNNNYPPMDYDIGPKSEEKQTRQSQHTSASQVMHVSDDHSDPESHSHYFSVTHQSYHSNGFEKYSNVFWCVGVFTVVICVNMKA